MVFPKLDMVAVTTARNYCSFRKLADDISGAVRSGTALPANPAGAEQLANEIRNISVEEPSAVGATPEIASAISGKTYRFPDNALNVKSLLLILNDPQPRYDLEISIPDQANSSIRLAGPIGLDGLYRKGASTAWCDGDEGDLVGQPYLRHRRQIDRGRRRPKMDIIV
jgi:hypothetical protein